MIRSGRALRDLRVTPAYTGAVLVTAGVLRQLTPQDRQAVRLACSTNVDNLGAGRYTVLLTSSVVLEGPVEPWLVAWLLAVLGAGERRWGPARLAAVMTAGHVAPSLLVYVGLRRGLARHQVDDDLRSAPDIGVSYVLYAVLSGLLSQLPQPPGVSVAALAGLAGHLVRPLLRAPTFTDVGHLLAAVVGVVAAHPARRT